jgi:ribosomal-protein-alanine N-acetyltransferase
MTVERRRDAPRLPRPSFVVPTLHAARVSLRPITAADVPTLFGLFSDGAVTRYWSRPPMTDRAQAQRLVRDIRAGYRSGESVQFGIEQRSDRALIGTCTLFHFHPGSRRAEIGYALGAAYWGRGLMHEALQRLLLYAFDDLDLNRLEADIDPRNTASARSLARLGFTKEGFLRERWIVAGAISDTELYGLLKREWRRANDAPTADRS